jgi:hypothetical protein
MNRAEARQLLAAGVCWLFSGALLPNSLSSRKDVSRLDLVLSWKMQDSTIENSL